MYPMDSGTFVPKFLLTLWKLVEDQKCDDLISWSENETSFIIRKQSIFASEILPKYYKHNNMQSFIRQLNMYGFKKMPNLKNGGLKPDEDEVEYFHHFFCKGQKSLLEYIKRKVPKDNREKSAEAQNILTDLTTIRQKQENMDNLLVGMKKENELLWRELSTLRQKHKAQEQIIQKVIQFLVSIVQGSGNKNIGIKRKNARMLHNRPSSDTKKSRLAGQLDVLRGKKDFVFSVSKDKLNCNSAGPVIHEVTELDNDNSMDPSSPLQGPSKPSRFSFSDSFETSHGSPDSSSDEPFKYLNAIQTRKTATLPSNNSNWSEHVLGLPIDFPMTNSSTPVASNAIALRNATTGNISVADSPEAVNLIPDETSVDKPPQNVVSLLDNVIYLPAGTTAVTLPDLANVIAVPSSSNAISESDVAVIDAIPEVSNFVTVMNEDTNGMLQISNVISIPEDVESSIAIPEVTSPNGTSISMSPMPLDEVLETEEQQKVLNHAVDTTQNVLLNKNAIPLPLKESDMDISSLLASPQSASVKRKGRRASRDIIIGAKSPKQELKNLQVSISDANSVVGNVTATKNAFSSHVLDVDEELDWLQDQLTSGSLSIDPSMLLGLFSGDDAANNAALASQFASVGSSALPDTDAGIVGNEVVQFSTPSLLDGSLYDIDNMSFIDFLEEDRKEKNVGTKQEELNGLSTPTTEDVIDFASQEVASDNLKKVISPVRHGKGSKLNNRNMDKTSKPVKGRGKRKLR